MAPVLRHFALCVATVILQEVYGFAGAPIMSLADRATAGALRAKTIDVSSAPITHITTEAELNQILTCSPLNPVVVKFVSPACRACKALQKPTAALALKHEHVRFVEVDVFEARELKRALGIRVVPTVHVYAGPLGRVFAESLGPSKFGQLNDLIERYGDLSAFIRRGSGGLMEKLGAFGSSTEQLPRLHVPGGIQLQRRPGMMEVLARREEALARAELARAEAGASSLADLASMAAAAASAASSAAAAA
ncbi:unnamed protein product [Phaeothamnion confervicola]